MARLQKQLGTLNRKAPEKAGGRHMYFGDLCKIQHLKVGGMQMAAWQSARRRILQGHGALYRAKSSVVKAEYTKRARMRAYQKRQEIVAARKRLLVNLVHARSNGALDAKARKPLILSSAPWDKQCFELYSRLVVSDEYSRRIVSLKRQALLTAPPPMAEHLVEALDDLELELGEAPAEAPAWIVSICRARSHFEDAAFCFRRDGQEEVWLFNFGMIQPVYLSVTKLTRVHMYFPALGGSPASEVERRSWLPHVFALDYTACEGANKWPSELALHEVQVLLGLEELHNGNWGTRELYVPLTAYISSLQHDVGPSVAGGNDGRQRPKAGKRIS